MVSRPVLGAGASGREEGQGMNSTQYRDHRAEHKQGEGEIPGPVEADVIGHGIRIVLPRASASWGFV